MSLTDLPALNAVLNATSALLLSVGYLFIRQRKVAAHRACMLSAFATSTVFLTSYIIYHSQVGTTPFPGRGLIRPLYFSILFSHTTLAVTTVPLVLITLSRALRSRFDRHKKIARWTLPIWLYVSVTGVVVYWMLYQLG